MSPTPGRAPVSGQAVQIHGRPTPATALSLSTTHMTKPFNVVQLAIFWMSASTGRLGWSSISPARSLQQPTADPRYDAAWSIATAITGRCCGRLLQTDARHIRAAVPASNPVYTGGGTIDKWCRGRAEVCQCKVAGSIQDTKQEDNSQEIGCKKERWYVHICYHPHYTVVPRAWHAKNPRRGTREADELTASS